MSSEGSNILRRLMRSRLFYLTMIPITAGVVLTFARGWYHDYTLRQEIAALEKNVRDLEHKKFESLALLEYVKSGSYVEEKARTELNLQKPGERVIIIKDTEPSEKKIDADEKNEEAADVSNPQKWWRLVIQGPSVP